MTKPIYQSKSAQGAVVAILPAVGVVFEQLGILPKDSIEPLTQAIISLVGGIWAFYGTVTRRLPVRW